MSSLSRRHLRALAWLLVNVLAAVWLLGVLRQPGVIETDLLAMLPTSERNSQAEAALRRLAGTQSGQVLWLVGHADDSQARTAARALALQMQHTGQFKQVWADVPAFDMQATPRFYAPFSGQLLSRSDRVALSAEPTRLAELAQAQLGNPFGGGLLSLAEDPFGVRARFLTELPQLQSKLQWVDHSLQVRVGAQTWVLVLGQLRGSPYANAAQEQVVAAQRHWASQYPQVQVRQTGALFFAQAARSQAQNEMNLIGWGSLIGALLLIVWAFRGIRQLLLGFVVLASGMLCATAASLFFFGHLHLLTLVMGGSLIGVAADYPIHVFARHLDRPGWQPDWIKPLLPGLWLGMLTTVLGYVALWLAPFPGLAQIAVFSIVGLAASFLTVIWWVPHLMPADPGRHAPSVLAWSGRILGIWERLINRRRALFALFALVLLSLPGVWRLSIDDDVHQLNLIPAALQNAEADIKAWSGIDTANQFFLVQATDTPTLLAREVALTDRLASAVDAGVLTRYRAVSQFVPPLTQQQENRQWLQHALHALPGGAGHYLDSLGYQANVAQRAVAQLQQDSKPLTVDQWLAADWSVPYRQLWQGQNAGTLASVVLLDGVHQTPLLQQAAVGLPGVTFVDKAASVSSLFGQYRVHVVWAVVGSMCLVWLLLAARYGLGGAAWVVLPCSLAMLTALAVLGYSHVPFNLFGALALMLILGIGVDYAIFLREGETHRPSALLAVLLSAATTLLSFGLLAFSHVPVLHQFGLVLLVGIVASVVFALLVRSAIAEYSV